MKKCGLLGEKLGHSYSPLIHSMLGDYEYALYEKRPDELEDFIKHGDWDALNVTIPYKKAVLPFCSSLSETARECLSVNTLVRGDNGEIRGYNTDARGFELALLRTGVGVAGKKALVLGNGGASAAVCFALHRLGARSVTVVSRGGEDNYGNLRLHSDAQIIVNATPVGMYPNNGEKLVSLGDFPDCALVADLIYNPARSALLLEAEERGIPFTGGLYMLCAQAKTSSELFCGGSIDDGVTDTIAESLARRTENIVLVGMPGCGKSTVAALLSRELGRETAEADEEIAREAGMSIPEIFSRCGEERFRELETAVLKRLGKLSGRIISTGGGCVTREENYPALHQNGVIVWLQRPVDELPREGRPLSLSSDMGELYKTRAPLYGRFADICVSCAGMPEQAAAEIISRLALRQEGKDD